MTDENHAEQPEQAALRKLIEDTAADLSQAEPFWTSGCLATALIAKGVTTQRAFAAREADLVGALEWIAIVCAEEIDLEYNDGMRKAFQRNIGSVANKALKSREASHG